MTNLARRLLQSAAGQVEFACAVIGAAATLPEKAARRPFGPLNRPTNISQSKGLPQKILHMDFRQSLQVKMGLEQRLVMTQSLQQAIRLLQLSRTELMDSIGEALSENPMLEEVPMADIGPGDTPSPITQGEGSTTDFEAPVQQAERNEIDWQSYFTDLARAPTEGAGSYRDTDEERPGLAQTLTRGSTLREHLEEQLATQEFDTDLLRITEDIIGNLDEDGYFRPSRLDVRGGNDTLKRSLLRQAQAQGIEAREVGGALSLAWLTDPELLEWQTLAEAKGFECEVFVANSLRDVAMRCHATEEDVIQALDLVKSLDPAGIASRDLRECLALQAEQRYPDDSLLHRLIGQHLPRIEARDYAGIRRDLRCTAEELERLLHTLATLEPRPGRRFTGEMARYITPDVFVTKVGDDYLVTLNEDGLPKLRIANYYHTALAAEDSSTESAGSHRESAGSHREGAHAHPPNGREMQRDKAREYLQEKLRAATWMIRSIHQRQSTIQRVTESIMRFQRPFLDFGVDKLRPLVLREVAEDVGLHESTVSRVTTNKYVHTPQGIYELKYFFGSRIVAQGGEDMAASAVRSAIKRLLERERPASPLSDQEIAEILQGSWDRGRMLARLQGSESQVDGLRPQSPMDIARRTVAKYREQLGIESSSKRRKAY